MSDFDVWEPSKRELGRFTSKLRVSGGCWSWVGYRKRGGYGLIWIRGRNEYAPRIAWQIANRRQIPHGLQVRHDCDNPPCVRPSHLRLGTNQENVLDRVLRGRSVKPYKTHCLRGHPYDSENTRFQKSGRRTRVCRRCHIILQQARRVKARERVHNGY